LGSLVARVLSGSWRVALPVIQFQPGELRHLNEVVRILNSSGAGALAWKSLRDNDAVGEDSKTELLNTHRFFAIKNTVHEQAVVAAFRVLRDRGIEPMLVKGWSIGRMYPESSRRPFGDIDLCVKRVEYDDAYRALKEAPRSATLIDLHSGFSKFYEVTDDEIWHRSRLVELHGCEVRVPSEEDHFRYICLHFFRHGADRPMWACDICVAIEMRSDNFDWDLALGASEPQRNWVSTAAGAAARLLSADLKGTPSDLSSSHSPRWVGKVILKEWGRIYHFPPPLSMAAGSISKLARELPRHWPNSIEATLNLKRAFGSRPRMMLQLGDVAAKGFRVIAQTRGLVKAPSK